MLPTDETIAACIDAQRREVRADHERARRHAAGCTDPWCNCGSGQARPDAAEPPGGGG